MFYRTYFMIISNLMAKLKFKNYTHLFVVNELSQTTSIIDTAHQWATVHTGNQCFRGSVS